MPQRGGGKTREIVHSPAPANPEVGTGRLGNSNNGFLRRMARATIQGRAARFVAPAHGRNQIQAHARHRFDDAGRRRSDDGARA